MGKVVNHLPSPEELKSGKLFTQAQSPIKETKTDKNILKKTKKPKVRKVNTLDEVLED
jgi:hypothetical protein